MNTTMEQLSTRLAISSLFDIAICVGIICTIGYFLWNKGRIPISYKR